MTRHFPNDIHDDDERSSDNVTRGPLHVINQSDAQHRSTQAYLHADLTMKERALALTAPPQGSTRPAKRYRPPDRLLAFLEAL